MQAFLVLEMVISGVAVKPYFEDKDIQIYLGDCRDILPTLPKVDLVLTDPPYGIDYLTNHRTWRVHIATPIIGDGVVPLDVVPLLTIKEGGAVYWFTTERSIESFYVAAEACGLTAKRMIVWDKMNWAAGDLKGDWAVRTEYIPWAAKGRHVLRGPRPNNILQVRREVAANRIVYHPTQKPVDLFQQIVLASSGEAHTILDPFMGSGTTLRAAKDLGRKAIGIEIEERYCEIAAKRLAQSVMQL